MKVDSLINIEHLRQYFESEKEYSKLKEFQAEWFCNGTSYKENRWDVKDSSRKGYVPIDFNVHISPGELLTDENNSRLLEALKTSVWLIRSASDRNVENTSSGEGQHDHFRALVNFVRWLRLKNIRHFSSINKELFQLYLHDSVKTCSIRLKVIPRLMNYLKDCSSKKLREQFSKKSHNSTALHLDTTKLLGEIGVGSKLVSADPELDYFLIRLKKDNGFYFKSKDEKRLSSSYERKEILSESSTRKHLSAIQKFINQSLIMESLFSVEYRFTENFFNSLDTSPYKFAKKNCAEKGKTKDIPQPVFFELMDSCIRWIVDYSEELIELGKKTEATYQSYIDKGYDEHYSMKLTSKWLAGYEPINDGKASPWPIQGVKRNFHGTKQLALTADQIEEGLELKKSGWTYQQIGDKYGVSKSTAHRLLTDWYGNLNVKGISMNSALYHYLPSACLFVIYAFTARREVEVEKLEAKSGKIGKTGPKLNTYIGKTYQEYDWIPVNNLVYKAFNILCRLSSSVRTEDNQSILQFPVICTDEKVEFRLKDQAPLFCDYIDLPKDESGRRWSFSEHQFRRFFAMMFFYRFDAGDLDTLSWHLRHTDWQMTLEYINRTEIRSEFNSVMKERIYKFARDSKSKNYSGKMAQSFKLFLEQLVGVKESRLNKLIFKNIEDVGYVLEFVSSGACFGKTPLLKTKSKCFSKGKVRVARGCVDLCKVCPNFLGFSDLLMGGNDSVNMQNENPIIRSIFERT